MKRSYRYHDRYIYVVKIMLLNIIKNLIFCIKVENSTFESFKEKVLMKKINNLTKMNADQHKNHLVPIESFI